MRRLDNKSSICSCCVLGMQYRPGVSLFMISSEFLDLSALTSCYSHRFLAISEATPHHKLLLWGKLMFTESAERSRQEIAQVNLVLEICSTHSKIGICYEWLHSKAKNVDVQFTLLVEIRIQIGSAVMEEDGRVSSSPVNFL